MKKANPTRIARITVGRLYNLGNYEHIRYEISVEVGNGSAERALRNIENILAALNPGRIMESYEIHRLKELESRTDVSEGDKKELARLREKFTAEQRRHNSREKARMKLDKLNGSAVYIDAKEKWDEEDRY